MMSSSAMTRVLLGSLGEERTEEKHIVLISRRTIWV